MKPKPTTQAARAEEGRAAAAGPSRLLRQIAEDDLDDVFVTYVDHEPDAVFVYSTCWRGLVSGDSYMVWHETEMPSAECFRSFERREMLALETSGVTMQ